MEENKIESDNQIGKETEEIKVMAVNLYFRFGQLTNASGKRIDSIEIVEWFKKNNLLRLNETKEVKTKEEILNTVAQKYGYISWNDMNDKTDVQSDRVIEAMNEFHNQFYCQSQGGFTESDMIKFALFYKTSPNEYGVWSMEKILSRFIKLHKLKLYLKDKK